MRGIVISAHAIDRFLKRINPGCTVEEAHSIIKRALHYAKREKFPASAGGIVFSYDQPQMYLIVRQSVENKNKYICTTILRELSKEGSENHKTKNEWKPSTDDLIEYLLKLDNKVSSDK